MAGLKSRAAAVILRLRSDWGGMPVEPRTLGGGIGVTPAMRPNCRSSGVATAEAMVSGLAPGSPAPTEMVGKSTCGSGATGKNRKATTPERRMAKVISDVATGRRMKGAEKLEEKFTGQSPGADPCAGSSMGLPTWNEKRCASQSKAR